MISLEDSVESLFRIAVVEGRSTSTARLARLVELCVQELESRGSLKSILRNLGGTVPNRIDDLMSETANVQLHSPEIVVGYIMVFDSQSDGPTSHGTTWHDILLERLSSLSARCPPSWATGMIEDYVLVRVDFSSSSSIISLSQSMNDFFDRLVEQVAHRKSGCLEPAVDVGASVAGPSDCYRF